MNLADLLKKNFVLVPVVASVLVGTFTGVRYIVNLTDTINTNQQEIVDLKRDLKVAEDKIVDQNTRLTSAESTWQMAENLLINFVSLIFFHHFQKTYQEHNPYKIRMFFFGLLLFPFDRTSYQNLL